MRDKNSPAYTIFRQRVGYLKAKIIANKLTPTDIKPQTLNRVHTIEFENEDASNKKRKRKSRWANDNIQVSVTSPIGVIPPVAMGQTIPQPIIAHKLGNF